MPRLSPVDWRKLECVVRHAGFKFIRQVGSHRAYNKPGRIRPITIPEYPEISVNLISNIIKHAGISREEYFNYLSNC